MLSGALLARLASIPPFAWAARLFDRWRPQWPPEQAVLPTDSQAPMPVLLPPPVVISAPEEPQVQSIAKAIHVGNLLDDLDDYFFWIRRLRSVHRDAYDLYSRVGGTVIGGDEKNAALANRADSRLPKDPAEWPAFFMISFPESDSAKDKIHAALIYFQKVRLGDSHIGNIVPFGKAIYHGVIFYSERKRHEATKTRVEFPCEFHVGVTADGGVYPLRTVVSHSQSIRHRRGATRSSRIEHRRVEYPPVLRQLAGDLNSVAEYVRFTFYIAMNFSVASADGIQINVRAPDGLAGRFSIPTEQTARFFKDREFEATVNGTRKKIFHAVREHARAAGAGRSVKVRAHYRGARRFDWKAYAVNITVPDLHHASLTKFTAEAHDAAGANPRRGFADMKETGERIRDHIWSR
jgi:hypothetical protein